MTETSHDARTLDFDGLTIEWDERVLRPRPWTAAQSRWIAELAHDAPGGPILELCSGAGHIGLLAARLTGRGLVQVDREPAAAAYAHTNARRAGLDVEMRLSSLDAALSPEERFPLVIADPPWLTTDEISRFPDDPPGAVDGGHDGDVMIRQCVGIALAHVHSGGHVVVQVGTPEQAARIGERLAAGDPDWEVRAVRDCRPGGLLVHLARRADALGPEEQQRTRAAEGGAVSESGSMADAGTIFPGDAVAGYPLRPDEGGHGIQEGAAGPEAPPHHGEERGRG